MNNNMLPREIDLKNEFDFVAPEELSEAISEYLIEKYGRAPVVYGYNITVTNIEWEDDNV